LDSAGGRIERAVLRERWKDLGMESNILRTVISRMKKSQGVSEPFRFYSVQMNMQKLKCLN
ncbi:hypothetical protein, partial [Arsenophonus sp.]